MLKTRLIPTLLLKDGRMVKGEKFLNYRDIGDPISAAKIYNAQYADELVFIDIEATLTNKNSLYEIIEAVSKECFMPLTVGGGVKHLDDIRALTKAGADKVLITSAALEHPEFIKEAAETFGEQCIVCGIDAQLTDHHYEIFSRCGTVNTPKSLVEHIIMLDKYGAGEFYINAIHRDGTKDGYDLNLLKIVLAHTHKPVVISGGAGDFNHLVEAIRAGASGVSCASLFHFADNNPLRARSYLKNQKIAVKTYK